MKYSKLRSREGNAILNSMGTQYKHLTKKEREMIDILNRKGKTLNEIANKLKRHKSTVSHEFKRNSFSEYGCYLASRANERAFKSRRSASSRERIRDHEIWSYEDVKMCEDGDVGSKTTLFIKK